MELIVTDVEHIRVHVPFTPRTQKWNNILVGNWGLVDLYRVTTNVSGAVGWGETVVHYTWKSVSDAAIRRVVGRPLFESIWDDSIGAGLQVALLDAAGKAVGSPARDLLGLPQVRSSVPMAWWSTKMPADVLAAEAAEAYSRGFRAHKFKARPWFDLDAQLSALEAATPADYAVGIDWNSLLLTESGARALLERLDSNPRIHYFESPVARGQIADQKALHRRLVTPLVEHFDAAMFPSWMREDALDGFVVDIGGASRFVQTAATCAAFNKEFWIQMVGTGISTAFALQLGAVFSHARWPSVTALNIFESTLIHENLDPVDGFTRIPDGPGLGVTVDLDAVDRYRVVDDAEVVQPRTLLQFLLPSGRVREYASIDHLWKDCLDDGTMGGQPAGATLDVVADDGSADFSARFEEASKPFAATGVAWPSLTFYPGMDT